MRRLLALRSSGVFGFCLCASAVPVLAQQYTADEVVAMVAEAMGGADRIDALETMRFEVHNWRDGSETYTSIWNIRLPNLIRTEQSMGLVVFDGNRASVDDGTPGKPELVPPEAWMHFPWDIALWFPAFFDYDSEYLGRQTVDGVDGHDLRVKMPLGGTITYFIESETNLPRVITISLFTEGAERSFRTEIGDYENVDGVLFPHTQSRDGEQIAVLQNLEFNVPFPDGHFDVGIGNN